MSENQTRNDLVGAAFGLLLFSIPFYMHLWAEGPQEFALSLLTVLFAAATASGYVASLLTRIASNNSDSDSSRASRIGVRTGAITLLMGGDAIVAATSAQRIGLLPPPGDPLPPTFVLLVIALSALPAILGGFLGALLAAPRRRASQVMPAGGAAAANRDRGLLPYLIALSVICYLLPVAEALFKSDDPPPEEAVAVEAPPVAAPPMPPSFLYEKPPGFDEASPRLWAISARKNIAAVLTNRPVTFSPSEELLFYCSPADRGVVLTVKRLNDFSTRASLVTPTIPKVIAWSSDSKRILLIDDSEKTVFSVWDLEQQRQIHLPLPMAGSLPKGYPIWWNDKEVVYYNERGHTWVSLETLRVGSIVTSPTWDRLDAAARAEALSLPITNLLPKGALPSSDRFSISQSGYIAAYAASPGKEPILQTKQFRAFGISSQEDDFLRTFPSIEITNSDRFLATSDGTKVVRLRQDSANIYYLGLREDFSKVFAVVPPVSIGGHPLVEEGSQGGNLKGITAFVCPPIVNPLNGEVVAANRNYVKGIVKFFPGDGPELKVWLAQEIYPITDNDVLADPWSLDGQNLRAVESPLGLYGWAHLTRLPVENNGLIAEALREPEPEAVEGEVAEAAEGESDETEETPSPAEEALREFIRAHHAKPSRMNLEGYLTDYSEEVDFLDLGVVDQNLIRKNQDDYYTEHSSIVETVRGDIEIEEVGPNHSRATYQVELALTKMKGQKQSKKSRVTLELDTSENAPLITMQRAESISPSRSGSTTRRTTTTPKRSSPTLEDVIKGLIRKSLSR